MQVKRKKTKRKKRRKKRGRSKKKKKLENETIKRNFGDERTMFRDSERSIVIILLRNLV